MSCFTSMFSISRKVPGINKIIKLLYSCDVPRKTKIGKNISFGHNGIGVVIHPNSVIGDNVFIQHHVTLGVPRQNGKCPIIKNNVKIGAYAIILGGVTVGENAVIGAGSIVTHDIPSNTTYYNKKIDVLIKNT